MSEPNTPPIRAYIENANNDSIGGFTIPLPTTKEALRPWLEAIEAGSFREEDIAIREARSSVPGLEETLRRFISNDIAFDELNYLAAKISEMEKWDMDLFTAALDSGRYSGSISELINMAENIPRLDLEPAFSEEQYGDHHIQMMKDNTSSVFERLEQSDVPEEKWLAEYILLLEAHVDAKAYGHDVAEGENGVFTNYGYLAERGEFQKIYRGPEDIPLELRIFTSPPPPMMAVDVDVPTFLAELHAVAGDYSRDAEYNLNTLNNLRSAEYLLLMSNGGAYITEAAHAYRSGTTAFDLWMSAQEKPDTHGFAIHMTDVHGRTAGNIAQVDITERQLDILENSIHPIRVEATLQNGETQTYTPQEWEALSLIDKDSVQDWRRVFEDGDYSKVNRHLDDLRSGDEAACRPVSVSEFFADVNAAYMNQAQCPQADKVNCPEGAREGALGYMLRVSQTAAKEMLARGDCEVYRLLPEGVEKLSPTDAVKSGLWYSEHREFAIRREDSVGLEKWAERSAGEIAGRAKARDEQNKAQGPEL